ncbi:ROK family protein [Carnobacterium gallinarum]|uniref:ROK family protein n=1 Tax=Carnobacterium gallinarum TaxID=2749 RepID=UPI000554047A|nr:ROK family protein [Carnobacterium gallinarum]
MKYYVGIDIGGTNIKYGLLTETGEILHHDKVKTVLSGKDILQHIEEIIKNYQKEYLIKGVGVSAPGTVQADGFMTTGGAIMDFYGVNLKELIMERVDLPVKVENDVNTIALAEKWLGGGREFSSFACLAVGTGIGGALIINNELYRGRWGSAGEFGYMITEPVVNDNTRSSTLSLTGSVRSGLIKRYSTISGNAEKIDGAEIYQRAEKGEAAAIETLDLFHKNLSEGIFNLLVSLDPEIILIGGAISENTTFIAELNRRVKKLQADYSQMSNLTFAEVAPCRFFNNAGIIGGVYGILKEQI